ncbi:MAG: DUF4876 domain-containing protein [Muribaculaceae bacterium]|nr:DUF4876 domain-containing protein [Muribaculaceae bacterium]
MKKILYLLPILTLLFVASCSDKDDEPAKYTATINLVLPTEVTSGDITELSVTATNTATGAETVVSVAKGSSTASFSLLQGIYNFTATGTTANYNLNGVSTSVEVYADKTVSLNLIAGVGSTLIFKEVYFTGVKSYYFLDAFYEIYNNTSEVQYLDGIIMGVIDAGYAVGTYVAQPSQWMNADGTLLRNAYPMTSHVQYFPGSGKDYPVKPYSSVVIAANPIDHAMRTLNEGDEASPVSLQYADWQLYTDNAFPADTKIEGVPAMEFAWKTWGREMMPATDGQAIIIARLANNEKVADYVAKATSIEKHPSASSTHLMIPADAILDAIDIVPYVSADRFKHIAVKDDAGMAWISGKDGNSNAAYSGKSLRRKVVSITAEGKAIFKDTNNSTNDFIQGGGTPTPSVIPTKVD